MRRGVAALACALACVALPVAVAGAQAPQRDDAAARAREQARDVLAQRRFHPTNVPAPLRSVRERIGAALRSLVAPFQDAFEWLARRVPGGKALLYVLLGLVMVTAAAAIGRRVAARDAGVGVGAGGATGGRERPSAARLRQDADRAEARGELDLALRLRFRAGLIELDSRELIELRPALTNHELLRAVPSPTLAGLVDGFEAVAYGGRPADDRDLRSARDGWPRVVDEAGTR